MSVWQSDRLLLSSLDPPKFSFSREWSHLPEFKVQIIVLIEIALRQIRHQSLKKWPCSTGAIKMTAILIMTAGTKGITIGAIMSLMCRSLFRITSFSVLHISIKDKVSRAKVVTHCRHPWWQEAPHTAAWIPIHYFYARLEFEPKKIWR